MEYIIWYILIGILVTTLFWIWHAKSTNYQDGSPMIAFLPFGVVLWPILVLAFVTKL